MPSVKITHFNHSNIRPNTMILNSITIPLSIFILFWVLTRSELQFQFYSSLFNQALLAYTLQLFNLITCISIAITLNLHLPLKNVLQITTRKFSCIMLSLLSILMFETSHPAAWLLLGIFSLILMIYLNARFQNQLLLKTKFITTLLATIFGITIISYLISMATIHTHNVYLFLKLLNTTHLILIIPIGLTACYLLKKTETIAILKDARYLRILHYELMIMLGVALAMQSTFTEFKPVIYTSLYFFQNLILSMISLCFAALFSIIFNNISDEAIDTVSNNTRPLIVQSIKPDLYINLGIAFSLISIGYAFMVNYKVVLLISACMASYWIYSMPPYRLKRIPVISKIILSINSILMIVLGYYLVRGEISGLPTIIYFINLFCFTFAANVIDLKDTEGDVAAGIYTLPVIIGLKLAKMAIGFAALLNSLAYYFLFNTPFSLVAVSVNGIFLYYLINKKQYDERAVLVTTNLGMSILISYLCITAH